jgi:hypothetical protein
MSDYGSDAEDETETTCANVRPPPSVHAFVSIFCDSRSWLARGAQTSKTSDPPVRGAPRLRSALSSSGLAVISSDESSPDPSPHRSPRSSTSTRSPPRLPTVRAPSCPDHTHPAFLTLVSRFIRPVGSLLPRRSNRPDLRLRKPLSITRRGSRRRPRRVQARRQDRRHLQPRRQDRRGGGCQVLQQEGQGRQQDREGHRVSHLHLGQPPGVPQLPAVR